MDDVFPVTFVCDIGLGSGKVGEVCILRYMLDWPIAGDDGWRWTANRVPIHGA